MNAQELRQKYISFFESKLHHQHSSGNLAPYDVTGKLDESLLFNGAGMVQFKPYFRGTTISPQPRLVSAQKCVRTGDIEEVGDPSHLTFFEMLGNFSFGDYFKKETIEWAWEFLTSMDWLAIDPKRLCITVFEEDEETYQLWSKIWRKAGFNPENRIFKLDEKTNYWPANAYSNGPPGPCGPNSEIFYWTDSNTLPQEIYTTQNYIQDDQKGKWLEIWNLVFIQYEWQGEQRPDKSYKKIGMPYLPFKSIDTGMGLERVACALGNHNTVYDTDTFQPIISKLESISNIHYGKNPILDQAIRIIADHLRTACFCIADGISPSNTGRGYVLRRLIRRAVLKGQNLLGLKKAFLSDVALGVEETMRNHYSELKERRELISNTLTNEEVLFRTTLNSGTEILKKYLEDLKKGDQLSGKKAFMLYDTFGFPFEVTQELCYEMGFKVDTVGYQQAMSEAQKISKGALSMEGVYENQEKIKVYGVSKNVSTKFVGYEYLNSQSKIIKVRCQGNKIEVALNITPFYAESGGQIGDKGILKGIDFESEVVHTRKEQGIFWHQLKLPLSVDPEKLLELQVLAEVELPQRQKIMVHHTATHLLHAALRKVLGTHVTQAGSLVTSNYLRFDFTHGKSLTKVEFQKIELLVNQIIVQNSEVYIHTDLRIEEAKSKGAMALFGEKYGKFVRMVQIQEFSKELCGGTHIKHTGEIGLFKILNESSVSSGVRRIEAVGGSIAYDWMNNQLEILSKSSSLLKSTPSRLIESIERIQTQNKELHKKIEKSLSIKNIAEEVQSYDLGSIKLITHFLKNSEPKEATIVVDQLSAQQSNRIVIVGWKSEDKGGFICKVGTEALKEGYHAGNIVKSIAQLTCGNGGGKADFATAGAKDIAKIAFVFKEIYKIVYKK